MRYENDIDEPLCCRKQSDAAYTIALSCDECRHYIGRYWLCDDGKRSRRFATSANDWLRIDIDRGCRVCEKQERRRKMKTQRFEVNGVLLTAAAVAEIGNIRKLEQTPVDDIQELQDTLISLLIDHYGNPVGERLTKHLMELSIIKSNLKIILATKEGGEQ